MMARAKYSEWTFTVEGSGQFPLDMLRYDRCFPRTEQDALKMAANPMEDSYFKPRTIALRAISYDGNNRSAPTEGRWESYTWKVVEEEPWD